MYYKKNNDIVSASPRKKTRALILHFQGVLPVPCTSGLPSGGGSLLRTPNAVSSRELPAARSAAARLSGGDTEAVAVGPPRNLLRFLLCLVLCLKDDLTSFEPTTLSLAGQVVKPF